MRMHWLVALLFMPALVAVRLLSWATGNSIRIKGWETLFLSSVMYGGIVFATIRFLK